MSHLPRRIGLGIFAFLLAAAAAFGPERTASAQGAAGATTAPPRRPFAKAGTPRKPGRLRTADVKHIKAELTVDTKKSEVRGTVTHTITPLHPDFERLVLDCGPKLKVAKVTAGPKKAACTFRTKGETLEISLDHPYGPADTFDVAVEYSGSPDKGLHFILPSPAFPERPLAIWTQGEAEETHHWLPCYDYPNDRATAEMIVTVDKPLFVLSNGVLAETKPAADNRVTYHWKMDVPFVSYLITLAIGDFAVYHDKVGTLPVDYYVARKVDEATARRFMGKTPRMIEFFGESIGKPYPYPKYAQVCVPDFGGGMENISATTMTDAALHDEIADQEFDFDGLVAHELAHQWFGDLLTCKDWSHLWLNEGFASYFAPLFTERNRGEEAFRVEMRDELQGYLAGDRQYRRPIVESRYESSDDMFDMMTYNKGACVLHMLRGLIGDDAWWRGIRRYVAEHQLQVVETDDFRKAMEAASGKYLKWFFDQWVYKAGHPELKVRWRYETEDHTVRIRIEQTQKVDEQTPLFRLPTTIEIADGQDRIRTIPIVIDEARVDLILPMAERPRMVQIDPKGWLIKTLDFPKSDDENLYQLEHAACVLGRLEAARALSARSNRTRVALALNRAWKREKTPTVRRELVQLMANGQGAMRTALLEAAKDPEAKVRVAAIAGLARLRRDGATEKVLRAAWENPREAYGARMAALRALVEWKVPDSQKLLQDALKITADRHQIAATALGILLQESGSQARELAANYSRLGQPSALRTTALAVFPRLAKDDPALQDILIGLIDDPDASVRGQAVHAISELKLTRALPALVARMGHESSGFSAGPRRRLQEVIDLLTSLDGKTATRADATPGDRPAANAEEAGGIAALEKQAAELETKARDLRSRIATLKKTGTGASGGTASGTSH
ncbi:MAG: M1 family aminopeptidase [Isosphaeraceae bacterium]